MYRLYRIVFLLLLPIVFVGCREIPVDALYALKLESAPTAADWERSLPREVVVKGGRKHDVSPLPDVDDDTIHVTTASCHHGATLPDPVVVDMRAFYTDTELFIRLSWPDLTKDDRFMEWQFDGERWFNEKNMEDGFGIMWANSQKYDNFTCLYACHLHDFGVSKFNFHARNKMMLNAKDTEHKGDLDLWAWKAYRTGRFGFADDRYVDKNGMSGDQPGEVSRLNSRAANGQYEYQPFSEADMPVYDHAGETIEGRFIPAGSKSPGHLVSHPTGGRGDVAAISEYQDGRWTVTLTRKLNSNDRHDISFQPGGSNYLFGLSIMDNTIDEHYASLGTERLILLDK